MKKKKNMICSICKKYNIELDKMINILRKIKNRLGDLYTLRMFSYGQSCGGDYCFYGIFVIIAQIEKCVLILYNFSSILNFQRC